VLTRAVIAHECTLAERSWRRQLSWPLCADHIKAVKLSMFSAASTLACASRNDRPSAAHYPTACPCVQHTRTHTPEIARI